MACSRLVVACVGVLPVCGCARIDAQPHVAHAAALVRERVGQDPAWLEDWDAEPPAWEAGRVLPLDEAVARALRNNRALRADLERIGAANADLVQAGLLRNPVFNFMLMLPEGGGRAMLSSTALPMQQLAELWLIPARQDVANAALRDAILRVADRAVAVVGAVKTTYARLQAAQRAIELIEANMRLVEDTREAVRARQRAGQATLVETNLTRIRHIRLAVELVAMRGELRRLKRELLEQIGAAATGDDFRVAPIDEAADRLDPAADEAELVRFALNERLDLRAAQWQVQSAERRVALERRAGWPEVSLGLALERSPAPRSSGPTALARAGNAAAQNLAGALQGAGPMAPALAPFQSVAPRIDAMLGPMIEMEIPIFDQNHAQVARALHEWRQRVAQYEAGVQQVTRRVREWLVRNQQSREQLALYRDALLPEVERNVQLARESFAAGREDLLTYLQAQEDVIATRLRALELYRDYLVGRAELERHVGGCLPDAVTRNVESAAEATVAAHAAGATQEHSHD